MEHTVTLEDKIRHETGMDVFELWRHRFPDAPDRDPREGGGGLCIDCQTIAWYGYDGLCGWCYEERVNPFL